MNLRLHVQPIAFLALVTGLGAASIGCVTTQSAATEQQAAYRADNAILEEKFRRLEGDIESLSMQLDQVQDDLERIQANTATSSSAQFNAVRDAIDSMQSRVAELEASRVRDRDEIVARLSEKIAALVSASTPAPPPRTRPVTTTLSDSGYEHVVQPGENLSKIAAAYGVSMDLIIQANGLEDPNALKAGRKLFIPD